LTKTAWRSNVSVQNKIFLLYVNDEVRLKRILRILEPPFASVRDLFYCFARRMQYSL